MKKEEIPEHLPDMLYMVTRDLIRAGKPTMRIKPLAYANDILGQKTMVKAYPYPQINGNHRTYSLACCYLTAEEALKELRLMVGRELTYQEARFIHVKNNLSKSERLAKKALVT